jgi:YVTN family beta-propeller protein
MKDMRAANIGTIIALLAGVSVGHAGQAPGAAGAADIRISHHDRVYAAEQFSNTVSVTDPVDNKLLGVIRLGEPSPANFSPLYKGQVLVHGMGYSPDHKTLAVVSIGSNSITFIDTMTNAVKHTTYVGRSPHEAFYTNDGTKIWVTVRGENYVSVIDAKTYAGKTRIVTPAGPGMQIFSPDGKYGYVCSSFNPETVVVDVATHQIVGNVKQDSPFCPNIAATPDGKQVWLTLKDVGRVMVFGAQPPFAVINSFDTGPITNHVNFVRTPKGLFAYVSVGGLNEIKVFRTDNFSQVATIPVGKLPHGVWPSADGSRIYVGLENADALAVIDTASNTVVGNVPIGQAPQAIAYVPGAVPDDDGMQGLQQLGVAGQAAHLTLAPIKDGKPAKVKDAPSSVTLFDQGLTQVIQAAVTGLVPKQPYVLALADQSDGSGALEALAVFSTNPTGSAIVNAIGPIRTLVLSGGDEKHRYLVIAPQTAGANGPPVQVQEPKCASPDACCNAWTAANRLNSVRGGNSRFPHSRATAERHEHSA